MRILLIWILVLAGLSPLVSPAQFTKSYSRITPSSSPSASKHYRPGSLTYPANRSPDTLYYANNKIKAIGYYAVDSGGKKTYFRVGLWAEFYPNGTLKSFGNYNYHLAYGCCSSTPCAFPSLFKEGEWSYYYDNGQLKAKGTYKMDTITISTGVVDQYTYKSNIPKTGIFTIPQVHP